MNNNIQKQNIFYKGRIYIDCEKGIPHYVRQSYNWSVIPFEGYLETLVFYTYTGINLKDGQMVVEGVDYELRYERYGRKNNFVSDTWSSLSKEEYDKYPYSVNKRIVAVPNPHNCEYPEICDRKEETQVQLWSNAYLEYKKNTRHEEPLNTAHISSIVWFIEYMQNNFTITRK